MSLPAIIGKKNAVKIFTSVHTSLHELTVLGTTVVRKDVLLNFLWVPVWFNIFPYFTIWQWNTLNCRVKLWLFISYMVSFVSLAGAVGFLVQDALTDKGPSAWTGTAGVLQCVFVLVRYLLFPYLVRWSFSPTVCVCVFCELKGVGDVFCSGLIYWTCHSEDWLKKYRTKKDEDAKGEYDLGLFAEMQLLYHGPFYHPSSEVWY